MSPLIRLADALVDHLNGGSFSQPLTAVRRYQPVFELAQLQTLQVSVVPKSMSIALADRATDVFELVVDVGVQKAVSPEELSELDALLALTHEIVDTLRGAVLAGFPAANWVAIANEPVFAPEHLEQKRVFTGLITVTYRLRTTRS